jgi:hypothetical protein
MATPCRIRSPGRVEPYRKFEGVRGGIRDRAYGDFGASEGALSSVIELAVAGNDVGTRTVGGFSSVTELDSKLAIQTCGRRSV